MLEVIHMLLFIWGNHIFHEFIKRYFSWLKMFLPEEIKCTVEWCTRLPIDNNIFSAFRTDVIPNVRLETSRLILVFGIEVLSDIISLFNPSISACKGHITSTTQLMHNCCIHVAPHFGGVATITSLDRGTKLKAFCLPSVVIRRDILWLISSMTGLCPSDVDIIIQKNITAFPK
jgi:hypothetical protein